MENSPKLVDSTERLNIDDSNNSNFSDEDIRPNLVGNETSTDLKLNLLANQMKITYHNSETEKPSTITEEDNNDDNFSITSEVESEQESVKQVSPVYYKKPENSQNERFRKIELLRIFQELEQKGITLSQRYNLSSDLQEMEEEYEILRSIQNKRNAVKLYRGFLLNSIQAVEFLNETYNPFDFHLKGWSEFFNAGINDYDEVLEELYEKYKDSGRKMEPEIKLMLMLATSATSFHASNTMLKGVPGIENMIKRNPNFVNNLAKGMVKDQPKQVPPEFIPTTNIKGPDPREFLNRMKASQKHMTPPPPPVNTRMQDDNISEVTSTSKRKKTKSVTLNI